MQKVAWVLLGVHGEPPRISKLQAIKLELQFKAADLNKLKIFKDTASAMPLTNKF